MIQVYRKGRNRQVVSIDDFTSCVQSDVRELLRTQQPEEDRAVRRVHGHGHLIGLGRTGNIDPVRAEAGVARLLVCDCNCQPV